MDKTITDILYQYEGKIKNNDYSFLNELALQLYNKGSEGVAVKNEIAKVLIEELDLSEVVHDSSKGGVLSDFFCLDNKHIANSKSPVLDIHDTTCSVGGNFNNIDGVKEVYIHNLNTGIRSAYDCHTSILNNMGDLEYIKISGETKIGNLSICNMEKLKTAVIDGTAGHVELHKDVFFICPGIINLTINGDVRWISFNPSDILLHSNNCVITIDQNSEVYKSIKPALMSSLIESKRVVLI